MLYRLLVAEFAGRRGQLSVALDNYLSAAYDSDDVFTELIAEVATELADLGIGEEDGETLSEVASTLVELDLDRAMGRQV